MKGFKDHCRRNKIAAFGMLLIIFSTLMVPITSANGGRFWFDCYRRQVDGWATGSTYTLTKGKVHLEAKSWLGDSTNGSSVYLSLKRHYYWGPYNLLEGSADYGQKFACTLDKNKNVGFFNGVSYNLSWNIDQNASSYYFVVDCDGEFVDKYGSGTMFDY